MGIGSLYTNAQTSNAATAVRQANIYLASAYLPRRLRPRCHKQQLEALTDLSHEVSTID